MQFGKQKFMRDTSIKMIQNDLIFASKLSCQKSLTYWIYDGSEGSSSLLTLFSASRNYFNTTYLYSNISQAYHNTSGNYFDTTNSFYKLLKLNFNTSQFFPKNF